MGHPKDFKLEYDEIKLITQNVPVTTAKEVIKSLFFGNAKFDENNCKCLMINNISKKIIN